MWMKICKEILHCTVDEAKARMTMGEFWDWWAYFELESEANQAEINKSKAKIPQRREGWR